MTSLDTLRYTRIPTHQSGTIPAVGFGTLAHVTQAGAVLGTLHYMSPEQVEGKEAGAASDIFSFGAVLYEMLTGQRAFAGENPARVIAAILTAAPAALPASARAALREASHAASADRQAWLEAAALALHREAHLAREDARELVGLATG